MAMKSKIKWAALGVVMLSIVSLMVHLLLAKSSSPDLVHYTVIAAFSEDFNFFNTAPVKGAGFRKLWGSVKALEPLQPYANPRSSYPVANEQTNGFIYAKVYGGFEKIRTSICDLVTIARLLNATLVVPEIQESTRSRGISSKFKSFSYIYNEDHFIEALASDVIIVKNLPPHLMGARKQKQHAIFKPKNSASPDFYLKEVLPKLKQSKVIGLIINDGGGLLPTLPPSLAEYQRLRCRVAFHALHFRPEIVALGHRMVERLRASGQPYLAYHTGLKRDSLAYHGCAELFQDIHTELIQYRRAQMIKQGILREELKVDSYARRHNGSCPLMPEEVGLLLRAMGYPPSTRIYLAGSETYGGPRVLISLHAMYPNLVDRTSLCSKEELASLLGPETPLHVDLVQPQHTKSVEQVKKEWNKAGPRPRPLPPPPERPSYQHEKEGWYGWVTETDSEPDASPVDIRERAHRLIWDAIDYVVSVEANAFFPGFDNDGSGWPDFSSLVMGHRLYEMASARTYRPNRKYIVQLFNSTSDHLYYPPRNWTFSIRDHLNKSLAAEGLLRESHTKSKSFLSHPIPDCSCTTTKKAEINHSGKEKNDLHLLSEGQDECPEWMVQSLEKAKVQDSNADEAESQEDVLDSEQGSEPNNNFDVPSSEKDVEMDPDD